MSHTEACKKAEDLAAKGGSWGVFEDRINGGYLVRLYGDHNKDLPSLSVVYEGAGQ